MVGKADEVYTISIRVERKKAWIQDNGVDKKIWICDIACPQQNNIETEKIEKMTKYRQLVFETRE